MARTSITEADLPLQRAYRWERERADAIFLTQPMGGGEVRDFTWAQAMDEARRLAAWMQAQDWEPGSRVGLMAKNSAWWFISDLAIWMAGHVSVPVYPNLVADSVRQILVHAGVRLVIVGKLDDPRGMLQGVPDGVPTLGMPVADGASTHRWDDLMSATAPLTGHPTRTADATATIIYTSGTTGAPKGAVHAFGSFAHSAQALVRLIGSTADDRALSYLPLAHVAERCLIESHSIHIGCRVFFCRSLTTFVSDLQRAQPTFFFSVPRLWIGFQQGVLAKLPAQRLRWLLRVPILRGVVRRRVLTQLGLQHVRFAGTGAAPLPPEVTDWYRRLGLELLEGYGMTEQFALASSSRPGRGRAGHVGEATDCCEWRLGDDGEILSRGPAHMTGYFREPEKTAEVMTADGWLRTGDLGVIDDHGGLRLVGRVKEQFKTSKGKFVSPAPIEARLAAWPGVECWLVCGESFDQPFALAAPPAERLPSLRTAEGRAAFEQALRDHLRQVNAALDPHERLDFVAVLPQNWTIESGFLTPTLKLKRGVIEKHHRDHFARWKAQRKPVVWHEN